MSLLQRVTKAFEKIAPTSLADLSWDNVGTILEVPFPRPNGNAVFLTIDFTSQVVEEALKNPRVGVIVSYHSPIFRSVKKLTTADPKINLVMQCCSAGVAIYSPHTSLDNCPNGVNDWLANGIGEGVIRPITPTKVPGYEATVAGSGRLLELKEPVTVPTIIERVKNYLKLKQLRVASAHKDGDLVQNIAICAGAGHSILNRVTADVFLSGEFSHHDILAALEQKTSVILCEHSNTERGYLSDVLTRALTRVFNEDGDAPVEVIVSRFDREPISIV
ncbi:hypothetical protein SeMB42_g00847 [Synchytrium endobioticum]|uniref:YbgI/family dinuclear metal center protein n=1 Tax=Synchytrium endobioticum TaxID=286115 RepID=A0A507DB89_9FUNG|nr:hypothetical protein SeLEV6574_g01812 [Synchytrium endobioticum]TPX53338.1 hypothetical protein SeMB42_g00847 [Synchytrium endobioticum]